LFSREKKLSLKNKNKSQQHQKMIEYFLFGVIIAMLYWSKPKDKDFEGDVRQGKRTSVKNRENASLEYQYIDEYILTLTLLPKDYGLWKIGYAFDPKDKTDPISTRIDDIVPRVVFIGILGRWRFWKKITSN
jgi:hypothetical protein